MPFPSLFFCTTLLCLAHKMPVVRGHCTFFPKMKNLFHCTKAAKRQPPHGQPLLCRTAKRMECINTIQRVNLRYTAENPCLCGRGCSARKGASSGRHRAAAGPVTTLLGNCFRFVTIGAAPLAGRFCRQKRTFFALTAQISTKTHGFCATCTQNRNFLVYFTSGQNEINFLK